MILADVTQVWPIFGFFHDLLDGMLDIVYWAIAHVMRLVLLPAMTLVEMLVSAMPENVQVDISPLAVFFNVANHWIPLDTMILLFTALLTFRFVFLLVRYVLLVLPWVG